MFTDLSSFRDLVAEDLALDVAEICVKSDSLRRNTDGYKRRGRNECKASLRRNYSEKNSPSRRQRRRRLLGRRRRRRKRRLFGPFNERSFVGEPLGAKERRFASPDGILLESATSLLAKMIFALLKTNEK